MYLVTNGTLSVQKGRLKSANISRYFEDIFISEELGYNKPSIEYFDCCFSKIPDFHKETAVIIGDSLTSDIQGGLNAEIRTIWFNPNHSKLIRSFRIMNLTVFLNCHNFFQRYKQLFAFQFTKFMKSKEACRKTILFLSHASFFNYMF